MARGWHISWTSFSYTMITECYPTKPRLARDPGNDYSPKPSPTNQHWHARIPLTNICEGPTKHKALLWGYNSGKHKVPASWALHSNGGEEQTTETTENVHFLSWQMLWRKSSVGVAGGGEGNFATVAHVNLWTGSIHLGTWTLSQASTRTPRDWGRSDGKWGPERQDRRSDK